MVAIWNDLLAAVVMAGGEVMGEISGDEAVKKAAQRVTTGVAAFLSPTAAIANGARLAAEDAQDVLVETGAVEEGNPYFEVMNVGAQAVATGMTGQLQNGLQIAKTIAEGALTTAGAVGEDLGAEGISSVAGALNNVVALDEGSIDISKTAMNAGSIVVGAGGCALQAQAEGASGADMLRSAGTGANFAQMAGGTLHSGGRFAAFEGSLNTAVQDAAELGAASITAAAVLSETDGEDLMGALEAGRVLGGTSRLAGVVLPQDAGSQGLDPTAMPNSEESAPPQTVASKETLPQTNASSEAAGKERLGRVVAALQGAGRTVEGVHGVLAHFEARNLDAAQAAMDDDGDYELDHRKENLSRRRAAIQGANQILSQGLS